MKFIQSIRRKLAFKAAISVFLTMNLLVPSTILGITPHVDLPPVIGCGDVGWLGSNEVSALCPIGGQEYTGALPVGQPYCLEPGKNNQLVQCAQNDLTIINLVKSGTTLVPRVITQQLTGQTNIPWKQPALGISIDNDNPQESAIICTACTDQCTSSSTDPDDGAPSYLQGAIKPADVSSVFSALQNDDNDKVVAGVTKILTSVAKAVQSTCCPNCTIDTIPSPSDIETKTNGKLKVIQDAVTKLSDAATSLDKAGKGLVSCIKNNDFSQDSSASADKACKTALTSTCSGYLDWVNGDNFDQNISCFYCGVPFGSTAAKQTAQNSSCTATYNTTLNDLLSPTGPMVKYYTTIYSLINVLNDYVSQNPPKNGGCPDDYPIMVGSKCFKNIVKNYQNLESVNTSVAAPSNPFDGIAGGSNTSSSGSSSSDSGASANPPCNTNYPNATPIFAVNSDGSPYNIAVIQTYYTDFSNQISINTGGTPKLYYQVIGGGSLQLDTPDKNGNPTVTPAQPLKDAAGNGILSDGSKFYSVNQAAISIPKAKISSKITAAVDASGNDLFVQQLLYNSQPISVPGVAGNLYTDGSGNYYTVSASSSAVTPVATPYTIQVNPITTAQKSALFNGAAPINYGFNNTALTFNEYPYYLAVVADASGEPILDSNNNYQPVDVNDILYASCLIINDIQSKAQQEMQACSEYLNSATAQQKMASLVKTATQAKQGGAGGAGGSLGAVLGTIGGFVGVLFLVQMGKGAYDYLKGGITDLRANKAAKDAGFYDEGGKSAAELFREAKALSLTKQADLKDYTAGDYKSSATFEAAKSAGFTPGEDFTLKDFQVAKQYNVTSDEWKQFKTLGGTKRFTSVEAWNTEKARLQAQHKFQGGGDGGGTTKGLGGETGGITLEQLKAAAQKIAIKIQGTIKATATLADEARYYQNAAKDWFDENGDKVTNDDTLKELNSDDTTKTIFDEPVTPEIPVDI